MHDFDEFVIWLRETTAWYLGTLVGLIRGLPELFGAALGDFFRLFLRLPRMFVARLRQEWKKTINRRQRERIMKWNPKEKPDAKRPSGSPDGP